MDIKFERIDRCPIMTVTKGNITFVYGGMDLILGEVIIKLDSVTVDGNDYIKITDSKLIMELESSIITEEESEELCKAANEFLKK